MENQTTPASETQVTEAQLKAIQTAQRVLAFKKYSLLAANVVGQIALGAFGCALMLKVQERKAAANQNAS